MKKNLFILLAFIAIILVLNTEATTKQCINYECQTLKIPLYLKALNFFDRHYNYQQLVKNVVKDAKTSEGRALTLFAWTCRNIRKAPAGFPIIDDHVWHIIIRGYGVGDQAADVFATLCNYAGLKAFYSWVYTKERDKRIALSFVRIGGGWRVFDPYSGVYFRDKQKELASIQALKAGNYIAEFYGSQPSLSIDYSVYFQNLPQIKNDLGLGRSNIQSPLNRLLFAVKKLLK